jgi:S-DNA-T family DNA segregation ATPase FtsK/SpoIIIE
LTDEANENLDQAQAVLYQQLYALSESEPAQATILRFTPTLRETNLAPAAAESVVKHQLEPTLLGMVRWAELPLTAPATDRRDLCATCPMAVPCASHYPQRVAHRDDPPVAATRPRNAAQGEALRETAAPPPHDPLRDEDGAKEAEQIETRILDALRTLGAAAVSPRKPIVGPRTYLIEVSRKHGAVGVLDRAAQDVQHRLATELGVDVVYEKAGGHRRFWVTRTKPRAIFLGPLLEAKSQWLAESAGRFVVGQEPNGNVVVGDFSDGSAAHLLVAGQTGSGKSYFLQSLLASLVRFHGPEGIRFNLVDPKRVTFMGASFRSSIASHLEAPVSYDAEETLPLISQLVELMEERYRLFEREQVQDIREYNEARPDTRLERRVLVIDEFQDLLTDRTLTRDFCSGVARLGAKARAAGIHLVLATQRPSADTVPPIIKANLCGRVALQVASASNSRIILDQKGAEALLGKGDMLVNLGRGIVRAQAPLLTDG